MFLSLPNNELILFVISLVLLVSSIIVFQLNKKTVALLLLFLGTLFLGYFIACLDPFLNVWDEQYHALVAKHMLDNPLKPTLYSTSLLPYDYKDWTINHIWLHKQPLFLWQIALSLKAFGMNELAVRIPSILLHALIPLFTYRIGKIVYNVKVGFYGALFIAIAYYPLELIAGRFTTDHNDIAFLFYVTASFWAWFEYQNSRNNYWLLLIGLFSGCAVLVKWLVGLLVYMVWALSIGVDEKREWIKIRNYLPIVKSVLISIVVFLPWQFYILGEYPKEANHEFLYNTKHFFKVVEEHGGDVWFHLNATKYLYGSGFFVPILLLVGLYLLIKKSNSKKYGVAILSAVVVTYVFYSVAQTKMISFCLIVAPFVFLGLGAFVDLTLDFLRKKWFKREEVMVSTTILVIVCFLLIRINKIESYHTTNSNPFDTRRKLELKEMEFIHKLKDKLGTERYVVFNTNIRLRGDIPIMFYTNHIAYSIVPTRQQIEMIKQKSFKIAILDADELPGYIKEDKSIVKIR